MVLRAINGVVTRLEGADTALGRIMGWRRSIGVVVDADVSDRASAEPPGLSDAVRYFLLLNEPVPTNPPLESPQSPRTGGAPSG